MRDTFQSIIVDANLGSRTRLKEVIKSIFHYSEVRFSRSPSELLDTLNHDAKFQAIFISSDFPNEELLSFMSVFNQRPGKHPLVVVSLRPEHQDSPLISTLLVAGVSGFICEPFSTEALMQLIHAAAQVAIKQQNSGSIERESAAIELMLVESMHLIDSFAELRSSGNKGGGQALKSLKVLSESLTQFATEYQEQYARLMVKVFEKATTKKLLATGLAKTKEKPPRPGDVITSYMAGKKISLDAIIGKFKVPAEDIKKMLNNELPLTDGAARDLGRVLGKTSSYWMGLQTRYDAWMKEHPEV